MDSNSAKTTQYSIFHHITDGKAPIHYRALTAPDLKGGFAYFKDYTGKEFWLSGNLTISKVGTNNGKTAN
jgi:hypothetical protein